MSYFRKSVYILLAIGLIPVLLLLLHCFFLMEEVYQKAVGTAYQSLSREIGEEIAQSVQDRLGDIVLLTEHPVIRNPDAGNEDRLKELERFFGYSQYFENITYVDLEGNEQASVNNPIHGSWSKSPGFLAGVSGHTSILEMQSDVYPYFSMVAVTAPVFSTGHTVQGVLVGQLDPERLIDVSHRAPLSYMDVVLIGERGLLAESSGQDESSGVLEGDLPAVEEIIDAPRISAFSRGKQQFVVISSPVPAFEDGRNSSWVLSLIFQDEAFYSHYRKGRRIFMLVAFFAALMVFAVSISYSLSVNKRLIGIGRAVEQLSGDEAHPELHDHVGDEISTLLTKVKQSKKILMQAKKEKEEVLDALVKANGFLSESNQRFQLAVNGANDAIWDWNIQTGDLYISKRWNHILGTDESLEYKRIKDWYAVILPEDRERVELVLQDHLRGETPFFSVEYRVLNHKSGMRWVLSRGLAFRDEKHVDVRMSGSHTDITVSRQLQEKLHFNAFHDELTDLPNRLKLRERLQESLLRRERDKHFSFSLLYLDFDGFKHINDSFGHGVGDLLLIAISERLSHCVRPLDLISRIGGDEFAILLDSLAEEEDVQAILDRIMREVRKPFPIDGHTFFISVSIGIAGLNEEGLTSPDEMIQKADIAMYRAKNEGKAQYVFYENSMGSHEKRRWFLENEMHKALGTHCMQIYYQPVISSDFSSLYGMEALLRWEHHEQGHISPAEFIPIAEESGFITQITHWLLFQVCHQAVLMNDDSTYLAPVRIALNVSSLDFLTSEGLDTTILTTLRDTACKPDWIAIEVTERILIKDFDIISSQLQRISDMGVLVELDDFGTGYSSLSYLNKFPLRILKIDRSFIMTMTESDSSMKLVQTIIHMAKDLGMRTIAEGVEEDSQRKLLCDMGCDYIQGYLIARPLPVEEAASFLHEWFLNGSGSPSKNAYF